MAHPCLQIPVSCGLRIKKMSRTFKIRIVHLQTGVGVAHAVADIEKTVEKAEGKRFVKLRVCTRALKTIQKKGLGSYAKELGVNLARL